MVGTIHSINKVLATPANASLRNGLSIMVVRDKVDVLRSLLYLLIITAKATGITWYVSTKRK